VWKDAFDKKLPVSGITVHQVLPGTVFDVGPVVMKAEVRIRPDDTFDSWRQRMDETEHLLVPTAMKRILHILQNGIDISRGGFVW
jgi:folate-dependent phosphoribosylglycinamide formyltransferase PurN